ncbi:hypothetical protein M758_1G021800 [Ceratodon purpureus]|nr:hypothetical protein M758_1G021800 [Ceratodon purpureus]
MICSLSIGRGSRITACGCLSFWFSSLFVHVCHVHCNLVFEGCVNPDEIAYLKKMAPLICDDVCVVGLTRWAVAALV